jgi:hypothetical protein
MHAQIYILYKNFNIQLYKVVYYLLLYIRVVVGFKSKEENRQYYFVLYLIIMRVHSVDYLWCNVMFAPFRYIPLFYMEN